MKTLLAALFALGSIFAQLVSAEDCPPHGCPLLPFDIMLDEKAVEALLTLRGTDEDSQGTEVPISDKEKIAALEVLVGAGDADKTTMTLRGYKGGREEDQVNQDRAMIYSPYLIKGSNKEAQLLGVFDGHGSAGEVTSQHAVTQIPKLLAEKLASISLDDEEAVSKAIKETFLEVDISDPSKGEGGATATIVLQLGSKLYVGNAGDSQSFISALVGEQVYLVYKSREDKPDIPEEQDRIVEMGGYVNIPANPQEDVPRAYAVLEDGMLGSGVAMSRSIGDWENQGVIAEPLVDVLDVSDIIKTVLEAHSESCREKAEADSENCADVDRRDIGILAASVTDGLLDFVDPTSISYVLAAAFYVEDNPHPHTSAEYLILESAERWDQAYRGEYRDDIAIAAFKVMTSDSILSESKDGNEEL